MAENREEIERLKTQLDRLVRTQIDFQREVNAIRSKLDELGGAAPSRPVAPSPQPPPAKPPVSPERPNFPPEWQKTPEVQPTSRDVRPPMIGSRQEPPRAQQAAQRPGAFSAYVESYSDAAKTNLEKFIGENLISKIGIVILVLGVGIGAKYAIDNGWISPLMRIIFGYVMGVGLLGFAVRLKEKYLNFSAVLLSGGMAIMYFVTYFAYAYYGLMPQIAAFALMAMFTAFTVAAAIFYNRQVIAHIGLVGAYAVPFLLSNNSGNYLFLFSYMALLNGGILAIAIKRYWTPLFYTSFGFTWLIFFGWFITKYRFAEHFYLALIFLAVFFTIFYATKIIHGITHSENSDPESLISIIANGFMFYGFAFAIGDVEASVFVYAVFFTYVAALSLLILLTSFRYYGRALIYLSYPFTWLIFGSWFISWYQQANHFLLAVIFATVFFAIHYGATLVYRLVTRDTGMAENMSLVLTNSFVFYGFGYAILDSRENMRAFEGLFTAGHAILHSVVAHIVSRVRSSAVDVVQVLAILIVTFSTISIPVQFDGNTVTLIFAVEAAALFWFGRARGIRLFEYFSYPVMVLATVSLLHDWITAFGERSYGLSEYNRQVFANGDFVTALVLVAAFSFIYITNREDRHEPAVAADLVRPFGLAIGAVTLLVLYNTFRIEIGNYFHLQLVGSEAYNSLSSLVEPTLRRSVDDIIRFNAIWQVNYTLFFLTVLAFVNLRKARSAILAFSGASLSIVSLFVFSTFVMFLFYELRVSYLSPAMDANAAAGLMKITIRYVSYLFAAGVLFSLFRYRRSSLLDAVPTKAIELVFDAVFYVTVLIAASCELVNLMVQFRIGEPDKLGLSILWAAYALGLIVVGIAWKKTHLRISAIVLLAVTLAKLFLYDVANLPTIPKTVLFISIGVLLLVVSFLYNKYRTVIFGATETDNDQ